jgi:hypothetical protein
MKGLMILAAAIVLVLLAALAGGPILERNRRAGELRSLRAELGESRFSADSCRTALARREEDFRRFDREIDSLRSVVDGYEDPEKGGVPQDDYQAYLERFEEYNDSVKEWQDRADSLQAHETRCRAIIEAHNRLGDSISSLQESYREGGT